MSSEDQLNEEARYALNRAPRNIAYDLLPHDPAQIPTALSGIETLGDVPSSSDKALLKAMRRQGNFLALPFTASGNVIQLRPQESRTYFLLQNIGAAGNLLLGLGFIPTAANALTLTPGSSYEPFTVPTNEVYILASAGTIAGILWYASEGEL